MGNLKTHKESKHECVRYECDKCEYKAMQLSDRETNKESKHDGVRYECYRFDFKATQIRYLRTK